MRRPLPAADRRAGCHYIYNATLSGLEWDTTYDYHVVTGGNQSAVFNFTTVPAGSDWVQKYIVYGDMGRHGGGMILQMVENEIALGDTTAIIHVGEWCRCTAACVMWVGRRLCVRS